MPNFQFLAADIKNRLNWFQQEAQTWNSSHLETQKCYTIPFK